ncbi:Aldose 1-epimerase [compost metagenome]
MLHDDGYGLVYSADPAYFKHWVLYTKGEAEQFLCIEPYTWLPDAPNSGLANEVTGLIELQPGQSLELNLQLKMIYPQTT